MRRSSAEAQARWLATQSHGTSVADLQRAVGLGGSSSPCLSGCRSVCWKTFLLSGDGAESSSWSETLREGRCWYTKQNEHFLQFIADPDALTKVTTDPLTDDPKSPWNTIREDEAMREEILQDVQRLPDEADYHEDRFQLMVLDILFVYCKTHPERGGYRQGMHELLAPILYVIQEDALDRSLVSDDEPLEDALLEAIDAAFIEHDAYVLFSRLMDQAQAFYAMQDIVSPPSDASQSSRASEPPSAIVERSRFIHEVCLQKIDPELADHLSTTEILPQIFLIRWIRLLFSREFPFVQFLAFWDTIFAIDPSLDLVDLICCAMLVRIRWQLLEADYTVCLQLLLKYPTPSHPHGPQTFVDDALYLRDHLDPSGGAFLINKYSGRLPQVLESSESAGLGFLQAGNFSSLRRKGLEITSPLHFPTRFIHQQVGVETLFHGVLEKGEKLGINQAVRDAIGDIRRNMHGLNEARHLHLPPRSGLSEEQAGFALDALEGRNKQLASYLDESVRHLKAISMPDLEDKATFLDLIEQAASKIQLIQLLLQDSSMKIPPMSSLFAAGAARGASGGSGRFRKARQADSDEALEELGLSELTLTENGPPPSPPMEMTDKIGDKEDIEPEISPIIPPREEPFKQSSAPTMPARSTIAHSSFSWMLEPSDAGPSQVVLPMRRDAQPAQRRKRGANNASREKNAFLFGETSSTQMEGSRGDPLGSGNIFGMEPLAKPKAKIGFKEGQDACDGGVSGSSQQISLLTDEDPSHSALDALD